jgi:hypothetical protein
MSRIAVAILFAVATATAWACGACDEDKIAATYDHATVVRAAARSQVVVFCSLQGVYDAERLRRVAERAGGIDVASIRTSAEPAALSFVVDPRRRSAQSAVAALQRGAPPATQVRFIKALGAQAAGPGG